MNNYQLICEVLKQSVKLYHGSSTQNLKIIEPRRKTYVHKTDPPRVFVTTDESFAACFTFYWADQEGFDLGNINNGPWILKVPKKFKNRLTKPCSIYIVEPGNYKQVKNMLKQEYFSTKPIKVLEEIKYRTALDAMKTNGVKVIFI